MQIRCSKIEKRVGGRVQWELDPETGRHRCRHRLLVAAVRRWQADTADRVLPPNEPTRSLGCQPYNGAPATPTIAASAWTTAQPATGCPLRVDILLLWCLSSRLLFCHSRYLSAFVRCSVTNSLIMFYGRLLTLRLFLFTHRFRWLIDYEVCRACNRVDIFFKWQIDFYF